MLTGHRANGASKIGAEPSLVAAAPEVGSILLVEHTLSLGKPMQVQAAAEVDFEERRSRVGQGDIAGLSAHAGEGLGGKFHVRDDVGR